MFEEPPVTFFPSLHKGAPVNAFISFERTVYLFSATEQIDNNIESLLISCRNLILRMKMWRKKKGSSLRRSTCTKIIPTGKPISG